MPAPDIKKITKDIIWIREQDLNKAPAFQFFPGAWLGHAVTRLSWEHQGLLIRVLALMWKNSEDQVTIKADATELGQSLGLSRYKVTNFLSKVTEKPAHNLLMVSINSVGHYTSPKLVEVRVEMAHYQLRQKEIAAKRWKNKDATAHPTGTPTADATGMPHARVSPSPSSLPERKKAKEATDKKGPKDPKPKNLTRDQVEKDRQRCRIILASRGYWNKTKQCAKRLDDYLLSVAQDAKKKDDPSAYFGAVVTERLTERLEDFKPTREEVDEAAKLERTED